MIFNKELWNCKINGRTIGLDNPVTKNLVAWDGNEIDQETYQEALKLYQDHLQERKELRDKILNRKSESKAVVIDTKKCITNIGEDISRLLTEKDNLSGSLYNQAMDRIDYLQSIQKLI